MTAEIAILNRSAIALAADSAITIGSERVWKSSNKLFHLSPHDIAIMVYGSDQHLGIPWETLIKDFRKLSKSKSFETASSAADEFLEFLDSIDPPKLNERRTNIMSLFLGFTNIIRESLKAIESVSDQRKLFRERCAYYLEFAAESDVISKDYSFDDFKGDYGDDLISLASDVCGIHLTKTMKEQLLRAGFAMLQGPFRSELRSGIVVAGFGTDQYFPALVEFSIDGNIGSDCRVWVERDENLNREDGTPVIIPFAQVDVVNSFMEGINDDYLEILMGTLKASMHHLANSIIDDYVSEDDKLVAKRLQSKKIEGMLDVFESRLSDLRHEKYVSPVLKVIRGLPKEEMAVLAEALVETTGLRRRMDSVIESVGGPVDVAVLSRADGFIWLKRKHYFDADLNHNFFSRNNDGNGGPDNGS